ncbi:MAG: transposase, partial [Magnetococcales bacterium]|nr:transposase [Magnetococcales bacterium]
MRCESCSSLIAYEREGKKQLSGRIEVDDAYWGGERSGGKRGRGAPAKTPFLAAVETTMDGEPVQMKLNKVDGFRKRTVLRWSQSQIA